MRLYNAKSRKIETFQPINPQQVKIYTCGPTVYDYPHIGNWYTFIRWDILARTLLGSDYKINWVMNITDVGHLVSDGDEGEDKLQKGAQREGKTAWEIADFYTNYFLKGLARLNFTPISSTPKATDYIKEQISLVKKLEQKGLAYKIDDGIYFDSSKFGNYGQLARLKTESLMAGARIEFNTQKQHLSDFALWKFSPKGHKRDMEWDSPWGKGFPGWHLECSALILKFLGETIDIHAGGIDHLPIHHTNEIAQSESVTGKPLANYWLHSNFVQVNRQKMSKSLGNFITLEDIESKGFSLEAFRLLVLESHYRSEAQFSWETMAAAQNRLNSYKALSQLRYQVKDEGATFQPNQTKLILETLQEDLNTPSVLLTLSHVTEAMLVGGIASKYAPQFNEFITSVDNLLGLKLADEQDITEAQKDQIQKREEARKDNDWTKSDEIRNALKKQGIEVRDTAHGPLWNR
jgi:cysteinyl-tRNA synthetase